MTSCFSPSRPGVGAGKCCTKCSTYCVESNSSASVILPLPMTSAYRRRTSALLSSVDIEKPPSLELIASRPQQQPYSLNIVFHPMGAVAHGSVPGSPPSAAMTSRQLETLSARPVVPGGAGRAWFRFHDIGWFAERRGLSPSPCPRASPLVLPNRHDPLDLPLILSVAVRG